MSSNETAAYEIMRSLDVDYVLIIFGGVIGYSGDDINKFLWMVRIAEGEHPRDIRVREPSRTLWLHMNTCSFFSFIYFLSPPFVTAHPRKVIILPPKESSEWTRQAPPPCSTALCTKCLTTALERCRYVIVKELFLLSRN